MFLLKSKDHWVKDTTETIKKFNLWKDMTATQKVKRNVLMEKFSDLIEDMYK